MTSNLARDGFQILRHVFEPLKCEHIATDLEAILRRNGTGAIHTRSQNLVGGRNLQAHWSGWLDLVNVDSVRQLMTDHLGERFGLVRILFFDKPPGQTWHLALHRDGAIAVAAHHDPPAPYCRPNHKAGVPHVQADESLLGQMLTLRLHLDPMHADNGPLTVIPGSHAEQSETTEEPLEIHCGRGDVFVMRPLLLHGSRSSTEGNQDHRRVVHLEFASDGALSPPYQWFRYDEAGILPKPSHPQPDTARSP
ncbi:MAG: phytanoyl-CoA dioxygenase family protein [Planctomycetota bacterium]